MGANEVIYEGSVVRRWNPLLGHIVRAADMPSHAIHELTGNPHDQGTDWALAGPSINGAAEFFFGLYKTTPNQIHPPHYHPVGPEYVFGFGWRRMSRHWPGDVSKAPVLVGRASASHSKR